MRFAALNLTQPAYRACRHQAGSERLRGDARRQRGGPNVDAGQGEAREQNQRGNTHRGESDHGAVSDEPSLAIAYEQALEEAAIADNGGPGNEQHEAAIGEPCHPIGKSDEVLGDELKHRRHQNHEHDARDHDVE